MLRTGWYDMDKKFCIYCHTNKTNGKKYIGQTCQDVSERWRKGQGYINCPKFYHAIQKYGWDNFEHEILFENLTNEQANDLELKLIAEYNTTNSDFGYNIILGGKNAPRTKEQIELFRQKRMGHIVTEETRKILSEKCSGWHHTEEERKKISEKNTGKMWFNNGETQVFRFDCPEGFKRGMLPHKTKRTGSSMSGKHHSEETKRKLSIANRQGQQGKAVKCVETGVVYFSLAEASRQTGADKSSIVRCCKGIYKQTHGYSWCFVEKEVV